MVQLIALVCFAVAFFEVCSALEQVVPYGSANKSSTVSGRIVGGENANIHNHPYQLALTSSSFFCGASIISNNWALTAAHCAQASVTSMLLRAGSAYWNSEGSTYTVSQIIVHPSYNTPQFLDNNVALLKVATPFVFGCGINKIDLPTQGQAVPAGVVAISTGWGMTQTNGSMSLILQMVGLSTISNADCAAVYGATFMTDSKVCAATPNKGVCQRDGGGPLVYNNQLIGVASFTSSTGCAVYPSGYARVAALRSWITANSGV